MLDLCSRIPAFVLLVAVALGAPADANEAAALPGDAPSDGIVLPLPDRVSLDGEWRLRPGRLAPGNLYQEEVDDADWATVPVPSNWFLAGHDLEGAVWYRHRFSVPPAYRGRIVRLVFEGVDYAADVWLNGEYLGFHEGYFQPFSFRVDALLRFGEKNVLAVRVDSPVERPRGSWSLKKRLIKGIFSHHDTRPGGAWSPRGQEKNTGGIWASVYLDTADTVSVDRVAVTPVLAPSPSDPAADASVQLELWVTVDHGARKQDLELEFRIAPDGFVPAAASGGTRTLRRRLGPGTQRLRVEVPVGNVRLWWTWDHGPAHLYRLETTVRQGGKILDHDRRLFGFRTVERDVSGALILNGRRIFLRGTNYIATQWLSEMSRERYATDVALMRQAHVNAVRVHAHVAAREFYEVCDRWGLLVWQDFPLQWGYEDTPELHAAVMEQARDMVRHLYNHPSIAVWSGHNEPPWDAGWMRYKYTDYDPQQNAALDEELYRELRAAEPVRYVHKVSRTDEHPWLGWYSGAWTDYKAQATTAFVTEFGAQALPEAEALRRFLPAPALWPDTEEDWRLWEYHNFQRRETFEIAKVARGKSSDELIRNTQTYQADLIQLAAESYRRQRFAPVSAVFQFMMVEDWPSMNWGIVDYWRRPKPGYYALQAAYQPVLPSIEWHRKSLEVGQQLGFVLWVINDRPHPFPAATLHYAILRGDQVLLDSQRDLDIPADSAQKVMSVDDPLTEPGRHLLVVRLEASGLSAVNSFSFEVVETSKESETLISQRQGATP